MKKWLAVPICVAGRLRRGKEGAIAANAMWLLLGQAGNILLQAVSFIILARLLGVREYGAFAGSFALVTLVTPYSALGSAMLFMRYVSSEPKSAPVYWGNALVTIVAASLLLAIALMIVGPRVTRSPGSARLFFVLTIANCLFSQVALTASRVFQTFEKMRFTAFVGALTNVSRLAIVLFMLILLRHATALQWSYGVLAASAVAAIAAGYLVHQEIGVPQTNHRLLLLRTKEGLGFSFAGTTQAAYNDLDKTLLSHFGMDRENGFYSLAYRAIDVASAPVAALDASILPRYFKLSADGLSAVTRLAWKSLRVSIVLGLAIGLITLALAPMMPILAGRDFNGVIQAVRWLSWIPLLRAIHCITGGALTGSGHQNVRTGCQLCVSLLNLGMNLLLIPGWGWRAAAFSSLMSDGSLAAINTAALYWLARRNDDAEAANVEKNMVGAG